MMHPPEVLATQAKEERPRTSLGRIIVLGKPLGVQSHEMDGRRMEFEVGSGRFRPT
ncbi:hypothetical protein TcasGA2_TC032244 [Tribolium castaneum]|uniref:Uncharacterized protein n=1 Tax=Tribolium castaneum TaxID=7070 RepID=A0A139WMC9_TRICA|nr:hypothetical protein TcasGA2_TC032244 [Tribolium castaneum]